MIGWLLHSSKYIEPFELRGTLGTVLAPIAEGKTGEIMYLHGGVRTSIPARGDGTGRIEIGREVVVIEVAGGIAQVQPTEQFISKQESQESP